MSLSRSFVLVALVLFSTGVLPAEEAFELPEPTPEHEVLGTFVGKWSGSGELEPGPFGPGGPMKWTEDCSWFAGAEFHVVCKTKGTGPLGSSKGLGVMGYKPEQDVYTHYGVDSQGWAGYSEGTRSGDTWTFRSTETMKGQTYHSRFTIHMKSPTKMEFSWEMSEDGESWAKMMGGTSQKK